MNVSGQVFQFPIAFPHALLSAQGIIHSNGSAASEWYPYLSVGNCNNTQAYIWSGFSGRTWLVIGYWPRDISTGFQRISIVSHFFFKTPFIHMGIKWNCWRTACMWNLWHYEYRIHLCTKKASFWWCGFRKPKIILCILGALANGERRKKCKNVQSQLFHFPFLSPNILCLSIFQ